MARKQPKPEEKEAGMERWLLTYADMITLLMLYFIIMFAMSKTDTKKFDELSEALGQVFSGGKIGIIQSQLTMTETGIMQRQSFQGNHAPGSKRSYQLAASFEKTVSAVRPAVEARKVKVTLDERGLVITLSSDMYFASGSAELNDDGVKTLRKIFPMLREISNQIRIEGNADDIPPIKERQVTTVTPKYPTNWELSSQRAINVLRFLESGGVNPDRMSAVSYADTRPVESNKTPEERAFNRRVDIVIMTEGGD